jgi:hypothetical protein
MESQAMIETDEQDAPEPGPGPSMIDPRNIHPAPEGLFSDGGESSDDAPTPGSSGDDDEPEQDVRGIVDPRAEVPGPDLF